MGLEYRNTLLYQVRYSLEHRLLPQLYFDRPQDLEFLLLGGQFTEDGENRLYTLINKLFEEVGEDNPYLPRQFKAEGFRFNDELCAIKVTYPTPEFEPLCYNAYLFFKENFKDLAFFCLEKGGKGEDPYLCAWFADGERRNFGQVKFNEERILAQCYHVYQELFRNGFEVEDKGYRAITSQSSGADLENILLQMEIAFPKFFFADKESFVTEFFTHKDSYYDFFMEMMRNTFIQEEFRFGKEDFKAQVRRYSKDVSIGKLIFPKPKRNGQLYCMYFIYDSTFEKLACFGELYNKNLKSGNIFLVEFNEEGERKFVSSSPVGRSGIEDSCIFEYRHKFGIEF